MPVYFLRSSDAGPIKIGWAEDVEKRRRQLQTSHPYPLQVLRVLQGARGTEKWLHQRYAAFQLLGEWFAFDVGMLTIEPPDLGPVPLPKPEKVERRLVSWAADVCWPGNPCRDCGGAMWR